MSKEKILGGLSSLVLTFIGMVLFTLFFSEGSIIASFELLYLEKKLGALMSLGALLNLPVFFYFLQHKRYEMAYGMIGVLMLLASVIALLKLF